MMDQQTVRRIVYFTNTHELLSQEDLLGFYQRASVSSKDEGFTGLSVYHKKSLLHVREGTPEKLANSIARTGASGWQYNMSIVSDVSDVSRLFGKWYACFRMDDRDVSEGKDGLIDLRDLQNHPAFARAAEDLTVLSFLQAFMESFVPAKNPKSILRDDSASAGKE